MVVPQLDIPMLGSRGFGKTGELSPRTTSTLYPLLFSEWDVSDDALELFSVDSLTV
jgi:hypothetical protein